MTLTKPSPYRSGRWILAGSRRSRPLSRSPRNCRGAFRSRLHPAGRKMKRVTGPSTPTATTQPHERTQRTGVCATDSRQTRSDTGAAPARCRVAPSRHFYTTLDYVSKPPRTPPPRPPLVRHRAVSGFKSNANARYNHLCKLLLWRFHSNLIFPVYVMRSVRELPDTTA